MRNAHGRSRAWRGLWLAAVLAGCQPAPERPSIIPDPIRGRQAIEAAMSAWKLGHPAGIIEPTSPRVQIVDTHRKPGQMLAGFEILADSADDRVRTFTVRLILAEPEERPIVRFLVVGIDPVLVFRREDYELLMQWEHRMDPEAEPKPEPSPSATP